MWKEVQAHLPSFTPVKRTNVWINLTLCCLEVGVGHRFSIIGAWDSQTGREPELKPSCERPWRSYSLLGWNRGASWKARKAPVSIGGLLGFALVAVWSVGRRTGKGEHGWETGKTRKEGAEGPKRFGSTIFTQNTIVSLQPHSVNSNFISKMYSCISRSCDLCSSDTVYSKWKATD